MSGDYGWMSTESYAGDVMPQDAWTILSGEPGGALVDVRTAAEWAFVGVPEIRATGATFLQVEWQSYPAMQVNAGFVGAVTEAMRAAALQRNAPIFFICRSGARSASAAAAMTKAGHTRCYNVAGGFEGGRDNNGHRGELEGWKAAGLPWVQS